MTPLDRLVSYMGRPYFEFSFAREAEQTAYVALVTEEIARGTTRLLIARLVRGCLRRDAQAGLPF